MITTEQLSKEYTALLDSLQNDESISSFEKRLISMGVISFMKRINTIIDGNLDDMYDGSLQEEE